MSDFNEDLADQDPRFSDLKSKDQPDKLSSLPVDPPPPVASQPTSPSAQQSVQSQKSPPLKSTPSSPDDLLAEAKVLSNLPIGSPELLSNKEQIPDLEKLKEGGANFKSTAGLFLLAIFLVIVSGTGGYFLGKNSSVQTTANLPSETAVWPSLSPQAAMSPTPTPPAEPLAIGDEVKLTSGLTLVLERVWLDSTYAKSKTALPTKVQVNVEVTFSNKESSAMSYTPSQFLLKDSKNLEYSPVNSASSEYKPLTLGSLLPGGSIKGGVSFVVPKEEKIFKLTYEEAEIIFSLSTQIQT